MLAGHARGRAEHLDRARTTYGGGDAAGLDDEAAGRAGSGRRRGLGCGQRRDAAGRMAWPGGGRRRRRRGRDELDVRPGGAGATEARSKMAVAAAMIDV